MNQETPIQSSLIPVIRKEKRVMIKVMKKEKRDMIKR